MTKPESAPYQNGRLLAGALNEPDPKMRGGIFSLMVSLNIKTIDTISYVKTQIEACYRSGTDYSPDGVD